MFSIKPIFKKKYPEFCQQNPMLSQLIMGIAGLITKDRECQQFREQHSGQDGLQLIDSIYSYLNFKAVFKAEDLHRIPTTGRLIIILNHPTTLDGLSVIKHLSTIRSDTKAIVNELFESTGALTDYTISVDISGAGISKTSFKAVRQHLDNEGVLIIFPAGKPSRTYSGKIQDPEWSSSFLKFSDKFDAPILPIYIDGKMSWWFYFWSKVCFPVSMLLPFREVFALRDKQQTFYIGNIFSRAELKKQSGTLAERALAIRKSLYDLSPRTDKNRL